MTVINMKISVKQVFIKIDQLSQINKNKLICYEIKGASSGINWIEMINEG